MIYTRYRDQGPRRGLFAAQVMSVTVARDQIHVFPTMDAYERARADLARNHSGREAPRFEGYWTDENMGRCTGEVFYFDEHGDQVSPDQSGEKFFSIQEKEQ